MVPSSGMSFEVACDIRRQIMERFGGVNEILILTTTGDSEPSHRVVYRSPGIGGHEVAELQAVASHHDCTLSLTPERDRQDKIYATFRKIPR